MEVTKDNNTVTEGVKVNFVHGVPVFGGQGVTLVAGVAGHVHGGVAVVFGQPLANGLILDFLGLLFHS